MTQIIPNGGDRDSQDLYTGLANEVTVDQSNRELRLHDGAKAGGFRIPNLDTLIGLFQKRRAELDGLDFKPNQRGFLARLGAGSYAIRTLGAAGGLTVENETGYGGNPVIRLGSQIDQDMTFGGQVLVKGVAEFEQGINADVSGNTFGDHKGGVDVRGEDLLLDDGQIPVSKISGLTAALSSASIPVGCVIMWAGAYNEIPAGWRLCDGSGGTPDLRGRFIWGSTAENHLGAGGSATHTHVATIAPGGEHQHPGRVLGTALQVIHMPEHDHGSGVCDRDTSVPFNHGYRAANPPAPETINATAGQQGLYESNTTKTGGGQAHSHGLEIDPAGTHTHGIEVEAASNLPPCFTLAFIMRTA